MYIRVKAKTGSGKEEIKKIGKDYYQVSVKEKAVKNAANRKIIELMRREIKNFGVRIVKGHHKSSKILEVNI